MPERRRFRRPFSVRRIPGFASVAVLTFAMLYAPIGILVVYSFNAGESLAIWEGFSLEWYERAWHNEAVQEATLRSLGVASVAATVATIAATMAALATTRTRPFRGMTAIYALINQPLMVPEVVTAVALLIFFAIIKVATGYTGIVYLVAAHTAFCIPFAYLPIRARLESMDLSLERAAADLYATPWLVFRRVTLPLIWPGIMAGFMLAFVISLRRRGDHGVREVRRAGDPPDVHAGADPPDHDAGGERDLHRPAARGRGFRLRCSSP